MPLSHSLKPKKSELTLSNEDALCLDDLCIQQLKQFWFSRSLLFCNGVKKLAKELRFNLDETLEILEISADEFDDVKPSIQYKKIKKRAEQFLATAITCQGALFKNLQLINRHFGMNEVETEIMLFATLIELDPVYGTCYNLFGQLSNRNIYAFLARLLDIPDKKIIEALKKDGLLQQSGLLKLDSSANSIDCKFHRLSGFCSALDSPQRV